MNERIKSAASHGVIDGAAIGTAWILGGPLVGGVTAIVVIGKDVFNIYEKWSSGYFDNSVQKDTEPSK